MMWRMLMQLPLARDVARDAARILDVLVPVEHLPDRVRLVAHRVPEMDGEDQRVLARIVVEDRLGRRVGEDAAVPVELAVDAHRRKRRRQRAGRHHVLDVDRHVAAVEVVHRAGAHMGGADGQPRPAIVDQVEVDQVAQGVFQRRGRVEAGRIDAERHMRAEERAGIGLEERRDAAEQRLPVAKSCPECRSTTARRTAGDAPCAARTPAAAPGARGAGLPAMRLALMAPIEVPMIQSGSMPASCSA